MDLFRISSYPQRPVSVNPYLTPSYLPDKLIEGWTSLIWTERFDVPGEFELKTSKVQETMDELPETTLVGVRDSDEVMIVETLTIDKDSDGIPELTITGRTVFGFLEKRVLMGRSGDEYYNKKYMMAVNYYPVTAAVVILWNAFVNTTIYDATQPNFQYNSVYAQIPNFDISEPNIAPTPTPTYGPRLLEAGDAYSQVLALLQEQKMGIRSIRPQGPTEQLRSGYRVSDINRTTFLPQYQWVNPMTSLRLDLYYPVDRSFTSGTPVVFNASLGHIKDPQYLLSNKEYVTWFFHSNVSGGDSNAKVSDLWGFDYSQAMKIGTAPDETIPLATFMQWLAVDVQQELDQRDYIQLITGTISPDAPYTYGADKDYYLGDIVTLHGEYGFSQDMRVSEYVRTHDQEGEIGFPGLRMFES